MLKQRADLTFKYNLRQGRHGWLRLTPAYSVKVVHEILESLDSPRHVLDPFAGTGTTGLVCGERGVSCDLVDINPFLVWLAQVKTRSYSPEDADILLEQCQKAVLRAEEPISTDLLWIPPLNHIERWWSESRLNILANLFHALRRLPETPVKDLLLLAFCRVAVDWSNASFQHQSMSFKEKSPTLFGDLESELLLGDFVKQVHGMAQSIRVPLSGEVRVFQADSRDVGSSVPQRYDCVITSPPYPNRMSYIRELRPHMYWLGYLNEAREAGNLDWEAIGGTWGIATSRLAQWKPNDCSVSYPAFDEMIRLIREKSSLLANYVHKYFVDIARHLENVRDVLLPGAHLFYIVGNSKFYETLVPVEQIYESLMRQSGYDSTQIRPLRKRNSKKELYEYAVIAEWNP